MKSYSVKTHKGNARLWLEGNTLQNLGFKYHDRYSVEHFPNDNRIEVMIDPDGFRKISGRKRAGMDHHLPIIDLCNTATTATMIGCKQFTIDPSSGDGILILQGDPS